MQDPTAVALIKAGTPAYRRTNIALFLGGFSTFWLLYWVQPLLPLFSRVFGLSPAASSVALSISTGGLALALIPASFISDRFGRKPVMCTAMFAAAVLTLLSAFAPGFGSLLVFRILCGVVLAGLPAVAMAYLAEEIDPLSLGSSMGLYIAGTALGGMSGRLTSAWVADFFTWRAAAGFVGALGLIAAFVFWRFLPKSQHFSARALPTSAAGRKALWQAIQGLFGDAGLPWLFFTGFALMGCFVSLYNYMGFRLERAPFNLSDSTIGMIFTLYLVGTFASAWSGKMADKIGRRHVLWGMKVLMLAGLLLTLSNWLPLVIVGIAMFTFAFFGGHTVASSWVGRRAGPAKALGASLYLSAYYLGSSLVGSLTGLFWAADQWTGVCAALVFIVLISLAVALRLRSLQAKPLAVAH
ncbi:YNFM family putative membrane transporter [Silvimonas terrae]|uniref:YNFM family putative membrane transporter n=1 Tax=Silvimonas terrae TaxID=300266 RepID=A0A840RBR1_9NEIS|nr:MFS transporter [Silvimonas terrae]MBB5189731.1 YNFM family putative membrane transporter [Silvimonas terrae]